MIVFESRQFPSLGISTKSRINLGKWFLFTTRMEERPSVKYVLIADDEVFFLSKAGDIIFKGDRSATKYNIADAVYFSDLPIPKSMSNIEVI